MKARNSMPTTQGSRNLMSPFDVLQDRIDRMFDEVSMGFRMPSMLTTPSMPSLFGDGGFDVVPLLEVRETDGQITVTAELPGMDEKDIDISVADQMLTISGEKKSEFEEQKGGTYRSERSYGSFSRSVSLPFDIDANKVDAKYDKGVLRLMIPKPTEAKAKTRKVAIKH